MKKLKHIKVDCPVFKCELNYVVNCDYKEFNKYCKKNFELDKSDNFEWLSGADGAMLNLESEDGLYRVIWLEEFNNKNDRVGVLVHETTHAVVRILEHKGIPFTSHDNQDETFAYLMDYFISNFLYQFKKL